MIKRCACCGNSFEPRPQVPDQTYCSSPGCQRARKRQWQRAKLQSDFDYRINQRAAQQAWSQRNPDYWRNYRDARPEYEQHNRELQRLRDLRGKMPVLQRWTCAVCRRACTESRGIQHFQWRAALHGSSRSRRYA